MSEKRAKEVLGAWLKDRKEWEKLLWKKSLATEKGGEIDSIFYLFLHENGLVENFLGMEEKVDIDGILDVSVQTDDTEKNFTINKISDISNVNALSQNQSITFSPNLTLVYGENGSGKSGYSRLLSAGCVSRGSKEVLPNLKNDSDLTPSAKILIGNDQEELSIDLEVGRNIDDLKRFYVFDSKSINTHVSEASGVTINPPILEVFTEVIQELDKIQEKLNYEKEKKKTENPTKGIFENRSTISDFCLNLNSQCTIKEVNDTITFTADDEETLRDLSSTLEEKSTINIDERNNKIRQEKQGIIDFKTNIDRYVAEVTTQTILDINKEIELYHEKKKLANMVSLEQFRREDVDYIGSLEWKTLIETAVILLEKTDEGIKNVKNCPLCNQTLNKSQNDLFLQYKNYLESKAEEELKEAIDVLERRKDSLQKRKRPNISDDLYYIKALKEFDCNVVSVINDNLKDYDEALQKVLQKIDNREVINLNMPTFDLKGIDDFIAHLDKSKSDLDSHGEEIQQIQRDIKFLKHKKKAYGISAKIINYVKNLKWLEKSQQVKIPKSTYTKKQKELFDLLVTENYKKSFHNECKSLNCDFEVEVNTKGKRGQTLKELKLSFAKGTDLGRVLSEGEQRVCALADFLTEVGIEEYSGIIFDDPVTSLDHERKQVIAKRLVREAMDRQVIIFTHDKVFLSYAVQEATEVSVPFNNHWIRKIGDVYLNTSPRLTTVNIIKGKIEDNLSAIKKERNPSIREQLLHNCFDWLRSAIESLVEQELISNVVRRYEDTVSVSNLARIPWQDQIVYDISTLYRKVTEHITSHNRSDHLREDTISIEEFEKHYQEFLSLRQSLKTLKGEKEAQVKKYRKDKRAW